LIEIEKEVIKVFRYEDLVSRNFPLLSKEEQESLQRLRVGIAGCGMGSQVALTLAHLGVGRFLLADGDVVEFHNLNRQAFSRGQVSKNKAESLRLYLKGINPQAEVRVWKKFISLGNAEAFISAVDLFVDCIDVTPACLVVSLALSRACRDQGKFHLYPIDLGWGARLYVFSPTGMEMEKFLGIGPEELEGIEGLPFELLMKAFSPAPSYLFSIFDKMEKGELEYYPQIISSTLSAAILVVTAIVKLVREETIKLAPEFYAIDSMEAA